MSTSSGGKLDSLQKQVADLVWELDDPPPKRTTPNTPTVDSLKQQVADLVFQLDFDAEPSAQGKSNHGASRPYVAPTRSKTPGAEAPFIPPRSKTPVADSAYPPRSKTPVADSPYPPRSKTPVADSQYATQSRSKTTQPDSHATTSRSNAAPAIIIPPRKQTLNRPTAAHGSSNTPPNPIAIPARTNMITITANRGQTSSRGAGESEDVGRRGGDGDGDWGDNDGGGGRGWGRNGRPTPTTSSGSAPPSPGATITKRRPDYSSPISPSTTIAKTRIDELAQQHSLRLEHAAEISRLINSHKEEVQVMEQLGCSWLHSGKRHI